MIRQTCQRCGHSFDPQAVISPAYERDQEGVDIFIGEWSRSWVLCSRCAEDLQRYIAGFFESVSTDYVRSHQTLYARSDEARKKIADMLGIPCSDKCYGEHPTDGSDKDLARD